MNKMEERASKARRNKERAIKLMAQAMKTADVRYISQQARFTPNMDWAWNNYLAACIELVIANDSL